jgi:hypothetical protein
MVLAAVGTSFPLYMHAADRDGSILAPIHALGINLDQFFTDTEPSAELNDCAFARRTGIEVIHDDKSTRRHLVIQRCKSVPSGLIQVTIESKNG